jgi:hypothetical protein
MELDLSKLAVIRQRLEDITVTIFNSALVKYLLNLANTVYLRSEKSSLEFIRAKIGLREYIETHGWNILLKSLRPEQITELRQILHEKKE